MSAPESLVLNGKQKLLQPLAQTGPRCAATGLSAAEPRGQRPVLYLPELAAPGELGPHWGGAHRLSAHPGLPPDLRRRPAERHAASSRRWSAPASGSCACWPPWHTASSRWDSGAPAADRTRGARLGALCPVAQ